MKQALIVKMGGVDLELGTTTPKEVEAMGLMVDYKHAQQHMERPYLLNCDVYLDERHVAQIGFDSGKAPIPKEQIISLPITRVLLNIPSLGFIMNGVDYTRLSVNEAMQQLGRSAKLDHVRGEFTEVSKKFGKFKVILVFEEAKSPTCLTITSRKLMLPWM